MEKGKRTNNTQKSTDGATRTPLSEHKHSWILTSSCSICDTLGILNSGREYKLVECSSTRLWVIFQHVVRFTLFLSWVAFSGFWGFFPHKNWGCHFNYWIIKMNLMIPFVIFRTPLRKVRFALKYYILSCLGFI